MKGTGQLALGSVQRPPQLTKYDIHDVLRNERRTRVLEHLQQTQEAVTLRKLSERVAVLETGETPPPRNIRVSVYNSLHQTHLPKLDELGIVEYETNRKRITQADGFQQVTLYMEFVAADDVTWATYYLCVGLVASVVTTLASVGNTVFAALSVPLWSLLFATFFVLSALYQRWSPTATSLDLLRSSK